MMVSYRFVAKCIVFMVFLGLLGNASSCIIGDSKACVIPKDSSENPCAAHLQCIRGWCLPPKFADILENANQDASVVDTPVTDSLADVPPTERATNPDVVAEQGEPVVETPTKDEGSPDVVTQDTCPSACEAGKEQPCYPNEKGCDTATSKCIGACQVGKQLCEKDANGCLVWGACNGAVTPVAEDCDGTDNDCNGQIDDVAPRECYSGAADTRGKGPCKAGVQACVGGKWETTCTGEVAPVAEICDDSLDNNCNGKVDDGCVLTVAGDGTPGYMDGAALTARFNIPQGLAFDSQGNLFVADVVNSRIRKLDTNGMVTTVAGDGTAGYMDGVASSAQFNLPSKLVVDQQGNVFIIEGNSSRIRKLDTNGMVTTVAGDGTAGYKDGSALSAQFNLPLGLAIDSQGNLYIADTGNNRIRKLDTNGMVTTVAGDGTASYKDGSVLSAQFSGLSAMTFDSQGNLYIADTGNYRIRKLDTNGMVTTVAGDGTAGYKDGPALSAQFDSTIELVFDSQGNLYIADVFNNRIRKLDTQGMVTTVAGDGTVGYKEGSALSAQFANPIGLAIDSLGDLYISDQINRRIRKLVLP